MGARTPAETLASGTPADAPASVPAVPADTSPDYAELWRRSRLALAVLLAGLVLLCLFAYRELLTLRVATFSAQQAEVLELAVAEIHREIGDVQRVTRLLKQSLAVRESLSRERPIDTDRLARQFVFSAEVSPYISQIRWLDANGMEQVRVNVDHARTVRVVPAGELQDKRNRYYFSESIKLSGLDVYISPLDLNVERGSVVQPVEPTLRSGIRTGDDDGLHDGVLVINFDVSALVERLRELSADGMQIEWLNSDGFWLLHPDRSREWGWMFGRVDQAMSVQDPERWQRHHDDGFALGEWAGRELVSHAHVNGVVPGNTDRLHDYVLRVSTVDGRPGAIRTRLVLGVSLAGLLLFLVGSALVVRFARNACQRERLTAVLAAEKTALAQANTNLKQALQTARALQDELVETRKLSSLGMMVAGVAHELNTPIGGALMTATSLQSAQQRFESAFVEGVTREQFDDYLRRSREGLALVEKNLARSADMVRRFKRLAVDRSDESIVEFDLADRVDDLLQSLHPRIRRGRIKVINEVPRELGLQGLPGIVSQVLQNLVVNALDHAFEPGQEGTVRVSAVLLGGGDEVLIEVSDDGLGIAPEIAQQIFDPFVTTRRGEGNTGLGMHLVHQWVHHLLHGQIEVDSTVGRGSVVRITLPCRLEPVDEVAASSDMARIA